MRRELKYGLLGGLGYWAWTGIEEVLGFHSTHLTAGEYSSWVALLLLLALIVLAVRAAHREMPLGRLEPWLALKLALLVSLAYAILLYIQAVAYNFYLNPGWSEQLLLLQVARLRSGGMPEADIRQHNLTFRQSFSPAGLAMLTMVFYPLVATAFSILPCLWLNWRAERARRAAL